MIIITFFIIIIIIIIIKIHYYHFIIFISQVRCCKDCAVRIETSRLENRITNPIFNDNAMNNSSYNVTATSPPPASSTTHAISSLYSQSNHNHHRPTTITVNTVEYNPNYPSKLYVITLPG